MLTKKQKDELVINNLGIARKCVSTYAKRFKNQHEDIVSAAYVGLIKAAEEFNPELGFQFSTFAWQKCRGEITRYTRDHARVVRLPASAQRKGSEKFSLHKTLYMEDLTSHYDDTPYIDKIKSPEQCVVEDIEKERVNNKLYNVINTKLTANERDVLVERFVNERTFRDIGKDFNLTKQRIEQIQKKALEKVEIYMKGELEHV